MNAVITVADTSKNFGRVAALDGLDLEVEAGEVHGLHRFVPSQTSDGGCSYFLLS